MSNDLKPAIFNVVETFLSEESVFELTETFELEEAINTFNELPAAWKKVQ